VSKVRTTIFGFIENGVTTNLRYCLCPHKSRYAHYIFKKRLQNVPKHQNEDNRFFCFFFSACPELAEELALSEVEGGEKKEIKKQRVINSLK